MQGVWFKEENKIIQKSFSEKVKANGGVYN
jgi:hypothetical protein